MSRDVCGYKYQDGSGCIFEDIKHDVATNRMLRQEPTHAFVKAESSDEATAFDVVAYNARTAAEVVTRTIAQRHSPAGLSGFSYDTAVGALEDCAGEAYNEGFAAGRAAAFKEAEGIAWERLAHWQKTCNVYIVEGQTPPLYDMGARAEASVIVDAISCAGRDEVMAYAVSEEAFIEMRNDCNRLRAEVEDARETIDQMLTDEAAHHKFATDVELDRNRLRAEVEAARARLQKAESVLYGIAPEECPGWATGERCHRCSWCKACAYFELRGSPATALCDAPPPADSPVPAGQVVEPHMSQRSQNSAHVCKETDCLVCLPRAAAGQPAPAARACGCGEQMVCDVCQGVDKTKPTLDAQPAPSNSKPARPDLHPSHAPKTGTAPSNSFLAPVLKRLEELKRKQLGDGENLLRLGLLLGKLSEKVTALDAAVRMRFGDYDESLKAAPPAPVVEPVKCVHWYLQRSSPDTSEWMECRTCGDRILDAKDLPHKFIHGQRESCEACGRPFQASVHAPKPEAAGPVHAWGAGHRFVVFHMGAEHCCVSFDGGRTVCGKRADDPMHATERK